MTERRDRSGDTLPYRPSPGPPRATACDRAAAVAHCPTPPLSHVVLGPRAVPSKLPSNTRSLPRRRHTNKALKPKMTTTSMNMITTTMTTTRVPPAPDDTCQAQCWSNSTCDVLCGSGNVSCADGGGAVCAMKRLAHIDATCACVPAPPFAPHPTASADHPIRPAAHVSCRGSAIAIRSSRRQPAFSLVVRRHPHPHDVLTSLAFPPPLGGARPGANALAASPPLPRAEPRPRARAHARPAPAARRSPR